MTSCHILCRDLLYFVIVIGFLTELQVASFFDCLIEIMLQMLSPLFIWF